MKKYIGLISSLIMITLSVYTLYHMNQPKIGPVAYGKISPIYTVTDLCFFIGGLLFFTYSIRQFFQKD